MKSAVDRLPVAPQAVQAACYCLNAQRAARRMARLYDDALRPVGLSHGQFSLLMLVAGLQPASVGQLATELVMDRTTVTAILKPLERRALVATHASPTDLRQRLVGLTRTGAALLARAAVAWQAAQALVQEHGPRAALRADMQKLAATAGPAEDAPLPRPVRRPAGDKR